MGSCLSSTSWSWSSYAYSNSTTTTRSGSGSGSRSRVATAKVVTLKGDVVEYKVPVYAYEVVEAAEEDPSSFLCNSDSLLFDDYIPALGLEEELEGDQIYFLLPKVKLHYKLSASDMAALAVKATVALQNQNQNQTSKGKEEGKGPSSCNLNNNNNSHDRRRKKNGARISPLVAGFNNIDQSVPTTTTNYDHKTSAAAASSSSSVRKLQRFTSRRAKLAVRSFRRLRLATIYEGIVF